MLSSIDLPFGELSAVIGRWYGQSRAAALGTPPHVTLLYPWRNAPVGERDSRRLEAALKAFGPFDLRFDRLGTFSTGIVYLALEDKTVPRRMKELFPAFPETPPYGGTIGDPTPHLTVAKRWPEGLPHLKEEIGATLTSPLSFSV